MVQIIKACSVRTTEIPDKMLKKPILQDFPFWETGVDGDIFPYSSH